MLPCRTGPALRQAELNPTREDGFSWRTEKVMNPVKMGGFEMQKLGRFGLDVQSSGTSGVAQILGLRNESEIDGLWQFGVPVTCYLGVSHNAQEDDRNPEADRPSRNDRLPAH